MDLAGQWNCIDMNEEIEFPAGTSIMAIAEDLIQRGYLYGPGNQSYGVHAAYENGTFSHLIWLDSSAPQSHSGMSFDIRASIDLTHEKFSVHNEWYERGVGPREYRQLRYSCPMVFSLAGKYIQRTGLISLK